MVVLSSHDLVREAFVKQGDVTSGRPFMTARKALSGCKLTIHFITRQVLLRQMTNEPLQE